MVRKEEEYQLALPSITRPRNHIICLAQTNPAGEETTTPELQLGMTGNIFPTGDDSPVLSPQDTSTRGGACQNRHEAVSIQMTVNTKKEKRNASTKEILSASGTVRHGENFLSRRDAKVANYNARNYYLRQNPGSPDPPINGTLRGCMGYPGVSPTVLLYRVYIISSVCH